MHLRMLWKPAALVVTVALLLSATPAIGKELKNSSAKMLSRRLGQSAYVPDDRGLVMTEGNNTFTLFGREGDLELWADAEALNIAVRNVKTGTLHTTSPVSADDDPIAGEPLKAAMKSLVICKLFSDLGVESSITSWEESVQRGQFELLPTKTGLAVDMTLGRDESQSLVSPAFTKDFFENEILPNVKDEYAHSRLNFFYKLRSADFFGGPDDEPEEGEEVNEYERMTTAFPLLLKEELYIRNDLEETDYQAVGEFLKVAGVTLQDVLEQKKLIGISRQQSSASAVIHLRMEFSLIAGRLCVSIPTDSMGQSEGFFLHSIRFLPYFAAAPSSSDGWLFLPDGSGSIVPFNDDSHTSQGLLSGRVYGTDFASRTDTINTIGFPLPCFGIRKGTSAVFATIAEGESVATISARLNQFETSYSSVEASFLVYDYDPLTIDEFSTKALIPQKEPGYDQMTVVYDFLEEENASVAGMADACRRWFFPEGKTSQALPLYVDVLGAVNRTSRILGVDIDSQVALTTYAKAGELAKDWNNENLVLRLIGAANGGLNNYLYQKLKPEAVLGGKKELQKLAAQATKDGWSLVMDVNLSSVSRVKWLDGYSERRDTDRTINGLTVRATVPDKASRNALSLSYDVPLRAATAFRLADRLIRDGEGYGLAGLSFGGIENRLTSDYRKKGPIYRPDAQKLYEEILSKAKGELVAEGAMAYAWPYASHLLSLPDTDSEFSGFGKSAPFMQMVLHGIVPYALVSADRVADYDTWLLRCIALGASPYFTVAADHCDILRTNEKASRYYAVDYARWEDKIAEGYRVVREALHPVAGQTMTDYEWLAPEVSRTAYSNGISIIVNTGGTPYNYQDSIVEPHSYITVSKQQ